MKEEGSRSEWGIKICPIRNKQCLESQCAWWVEEDRICAVKPKIRIRQDENSR